MIDNNGDGESKKIHQAIHDKFWNDYIVNTSSLSQVCRQLAFGEGAACWFFKTPTATFPQPIYTVLLFLILFFLTDAMQYLLSSEIYRCVAKVYEDQLNNGSLKDEKNVIKRSWINFPGRACFLLKLLFLGISSFLLICIFFHANGITQVIVK